MYATQFLALLTAMFGGSKLTVFAGGLFSMSLTTVTRLCLLEGCFDVLDNHHKTVFAGGLF